MNSKLSSEPETAQPFEDRPPRTTLLLHVLLLPAYLCLIAAYVVVTRIRGLTPI